MGLNCACGAPCAPKKPPTRHLSPMFPTGMSQESPSASDAMAREKLHRRGVLWHDSDVQCANHPGDGGITGVALSRQRFVQALPTHSSEFGYLGHALFPGEKAKGHQKNAGVFIKKGRSQVGVDFLRAFKIVERIVRGRFRFHDVHPIVLAISFALRMSLSWLDLSPPTSRSTTASPLMANYSRYRGRKNSRNVDRSQAGAYGHDHGERGAPKGRAGTGGRGQQVADRRGEKSFAPTCDRGWSPLDGRCRHLGGVSLMVVTRQRGANHFADLSLYYRGHGPLLQRHQLSSVGAGRARDVRVDTRVLCRSRVLRAIAPYNASSNPAPTQDRVAGCRGKKSFSPTRDRG